MSIACLGIGVGAEVRVATGPAHLLCYGPVCVTPGSVAADGVDAEVLRFERAIDTAVQQLRGLRGQIPDDTPPDVLEFVDTHLLMLEDKALSAQPVNLIRQEGLSAEWALQQHRNYLVGIFERMEDAYLRTRKDDLDHVINRILKILLEQHDEPLDRLDGRIVVAEDLTPADVILIKHRGAGGFVTEYGGPMSHTAILARSLGIPAVIGAHGATDCLRHGEILVLDAENGIVQADCSPALLDFFGRRRSADHARVSELRSHVAEPSTTKDEQSITLLANIELAEDVAAARNNGASGVGLYRTEFLYMNRDAPPDEEEHYAAYCAVIEGMEGRAVTIRTMDLGADKQPASGALLPSAANPALGLRAIRLCLKEPTLFLPQLRAILRASALGPVRIMLPMLTCLWEVVEAQRIIRSIMAEFEETGVAYDRDLRIGGMIEVPAAALTAASFARQLDFLSIGTNDLIQYALAIDRIDDEVNYLYDPCHPAVLRLLREILLAGREQDIPVGMCGEMAGDTRFLPLLIGMGLREFSMQPSALLDAKELVQQLDAGALAARMPAFFEELDAGNAADLLGTLQP